MMSSDPPPAFQPEPPRFTIRGLLIATAIVAVYAAIGGIFVRRLDSSSQIALLAFWATITGLTPIIWWWSCCLENKQLRQAANHPGVRFEVWSEFPSVASHWPLWGKWAARIGVVALPATGFSAMVVSRVERPQYTPFDWLDGSVYTAFLCLLGCISVAAFIVQFLLRRGRGRFWICEDGVAMGKRIVPWKVIRDVRSHAGNPDALILEWLALSQLTHKLAVMPHHGQYEQVEAFIRERTGIPALRK